MKELDPIALFRLSVLGLLVSRAQLAHGELQATLRELAQKEYDIPGSARRHLSEKTLQAWYYAYRRHGLTGLSPKQRSDRGQSKLSPAVQERLLALKRENPRRSIRMLRLMLEQEGLVRRCLLSRSAIHRFLKQHGLSRVGAADLTVSPERRSFVSEHAGALWYGDVMHGPHALVRGRRRKTYLVSLMDDASRLIAHSAFCLSESALDVEGVLKQALLKRGAVRKLVVDNGAAYRAGSLQSICARLAIQLVYCRPYSPESKGKLERWHRTLREQFLSEQKSCIELQELNARLWAWIELYHRTPHAGLANRTPLERYQQDLAVIRPLGALAAQLDSLFQHRVQRLVRKNGTVSYKGRFFEVPCELSGKTLYLVVDPHSQQALSMEDEQGRCLGAAVPLDELANRHRTRRRPMPACAEEATQNAHYTGPTLLQFTCAPPDAAMAQPPSSTSTPPVAAPNATQGP